MRNFLELISEEEKRSKLKHPDKMTFISFFGVFNQRFNMVSNWFNHNKFNDGKVKAMIAITLVQFCVVAKRFVEETLQFDQSYYDEVIKASDGKE